MRILAILVFCTTLYATADTHQSPLTIGKGINEDDKETLWPLNCSTENVSVILLADIKNYNPDALKAGMDPKFVAVETDYRNLLKVVSSKCPDRNPVSKNEDFKSSHIVPESSIYEYKITVAEEQVSSKLEAMLNYIDITPNSILIVFKQLPTKQFELYPVYNGLLLESNTFFTSGVWITLIATLIIIYALYYAMSWLVSIQA